MKNGEKNLPKLSPSPTKIIEKSKKSLPNPISDAGAPRNRKKLEKNTKNEPT